MTAEPRFATYPEIVRLRELRAAGLSFRECARAMRCTRSRVSGLVRRHLSGKTPGSTRRKRYEDDRRAWRMAHPIVESSAPFVITPELELERAARLANQQWREPTPTLSMADIEILQLKGVI